MSITLTLLLLCASLLQESPYIPQRTSLTEKTIPNVDSSILVTAVSLCARSLSEDYIKDNPAYPALVWLRSNLGEFFDVTPAGLAYLIQNPAPGFLTHHSLILHLEDDSLLAVETGTQKISVNSKISPCSFSKTTKQLKEPVPLKNFLTKVAGWEKEKQTYNVLSFLSWTAGYNPGFRTFNCQTFCAELLQVAKFSVGEIIFLSYGQFVMLTDAICLLIIMTISYIFTWTLLSILSWSSKWFAAHQISVWLLSLVMDAILLFLGTLWCNYYYWHEDCDKLYELGGIVLCLFICSFIPRCLWLISLCFYPFEILFRKYTSYCWSYVVMMGWISVQTLKTFISSMWILGIFGKKAKDLSWRIFEHVCSLVNYRPKMVAPGLFMRLWDKILQFYSLSAVSVTCVIAIAEICFLLSFNHHIREFFVNAQLHICYNWISTHRKFVLSVLLAIGVNISSVPLYILLFGIIAQLLTWCLLVLGLAIETIANLCCFALWATGVLLRLVIQLCKLVLHASFSLAITALALAVMIHMCTVTSSASLQVS